MWGTTRLCFSRIGSYRMGTTETYFSPVERMKKKVTRKSLPRTMKTMLREYKDSPEKFKGGKKQAMAIAYSKVRRRTG